MTIFGFAFLLQKWIPREVAGRDAIRTTEPPVEPKATMHSLTSTRPRRTVGKMSDYRKPTDGAVFQRYRPLGPQQPAQRPKARRPFWGERERCTHPSAAAPAIGSLDRRLRR